MLSDLVADFVAVADLPRLLCWLIPRSIFIKEAQPLAGDRYHLDWIVVPLGKHSTKVPLESKFLEFKLTGKQGL